MHNIRELQKNPDWNIVEKGAETARRVVQRGAGAQMRCNFVWRLR